VAPINGSPASSFTVPVAVNCANETCTPNTNNKALRSTLNLMFIKPVLNYEKYKTNSTAEMAKQIAL
jgi:hypothetical protein